MANLFTFGNTLCYHEPTQHYQTLVREHANMRVGISDSTLPFYFDLIVRQYPDAPWVYVRRNPKDALESFRRFVGNIVTFPKSKDLQFFNELHGKLEMITDSPLVMTVEFNDLADMDYLRKVWAWCVAEPFCETRAKLLQGFRVEQMLAPALKERGIQ